MPEVGAVLGLLSKKIDIGMRFYKFREKLKGYTERKFDNVKDVMCVVIDRKDPLKSLKRKKFRIILYEHEAKSILKKKSQELALMR